MRLWQFQEEIYVEALLWFREMLNKNLPDAEIIIPEPRVAKH